MVCESLLSQAAIRSPCRTGKISRATSGSIHEGEPPYSCAPILEYLLYELFGRVSRKLDVLKNFVKCYPNISNFYTIII